MSDAENQIEMKTQLVQASLPQGFGEQVQVASNLRPVMLRTNLDFLYVFDKGKIDANKLLESLRLVLNHYPTMAGRIASCHIRIDLNNAGAAFTIASSNLRAQDLPLETPIGAPYCNIPSPEGQVQGKEPLLTVTLTTFETGCTLGVVMSHLIADGWTFAMFMKDWSDLYNNTSIQPVEYILPDNVMKMCKDRAQANQAAHMLGLKQCSRFKRKFLKLLFYTILPKMMVSDDRGSDQVTRLVLHYSDEDVCKIKQAAEARSKTWISTNEAMLAHLWPILLDAAAIDNSKRELLGAGLAVNLREKINGVSDRVAGNVMASMGVRCYLSTYDGLEQRLHDEIRAMLTQERLSNLSKLQNYIWNSADTFDWYVDAQVGDILLGGIPGSISWNNQVSSPFFQIDFGAGPPSRGVLWNWKQPVTLMPGPQGGIDVYIDKGERGHGTWKKPPKKWFIAKNCCLLGAFGTAAALFRGKRSRLDLPLALFGGTMCLIAAYAGKQARLQAEQSTRVFFEILEKNAHAISDREKVLK